eukprot:s689_g6.t1
MTETKRIIANGHYKIEDASVKLDKRRLVVAPKHALKFDFDDISQHFATESSVGRSPCRIRLLQCDCLEAAELLKAEHGSMPVVLDFASGSNPGGGVKGNQQGTQEEDICRRSSLLPSLEQQDYPLPSMGGIYAPDICVFRGPGRNGYPLLKEPFWIAILAAEMPNLAEIGKKKRIFIQRKVQGVLHMALRHGHSSLVLGAWGCGAFGNDARTMATIFKEELDKIGAMDVVFAILGHNANIFSEVLELQVSAPEGKPAAKATETDETRETIPVEKASREQKKWDMIWKLHISISNNVSHDAMVEAQETNASKLSLLQRHREARELLVKIQSEPKEVSERRRPQSACSEVFGKRGSQSSTDRPKSAAPSTGVRGDAAAAANVHFRPVPNPLPPHLGGGSSGSTSSAPRKRPLSAFPSRVAVSQVGRRPASACGVRERFDHEASKKKESPSNPGSSEAPSESTRGALPSQGPDLLAFAARFGPAPPLPPLPPELDRGNSARNAPGPEEELDDFTPEERRLEQESEEALNQLEALDAAVEALRMKLEVSKEDVECSQAELLQLRSAASSWAKAAEESRQELKDRELRLQELLAVLPAEEEEESDKQTALAAERLRVLQLQTDRLREQVEVQQALLLQRLEERKALESQVEGLTSERDEQRAVQQKARAALRTAESQLKVKEEALSAFARRRQDLERQSVRMRGEVRGLKARLTTSSTWQLGRVGYMVSECAADTGVNWALWRERPRMATSVLARLAKDGIKKTLDLLGEMNRQEVETNIFHFSCAISACEKLADWSMALEILQKMEERQVPCNVVSCSSTLSACEKASQWPMALELLQTMTQQQITPNLIALSSTISACEKGGEWQMALELFASAHMDHDVVSYSAMISACAQGGQWQLAVHILQAMTERKTEPNIITFNSVISAHEKGRQWQRALHFLLCMFQANKAPNVISISATISACEKSGQWQRGLLLLNTMPVWSVKPNLVSFNAAISAAEKAQEWEVALQLLSTMLLQKVLPSVVSYSSAVSACEKSLQWEMALALMAAMPLARVMPSQVTYNSVISACEKGSQWQSAVFLLFSMPKARVEQDVLSFGAAISACAHSHHWRSALCLLKLNAADVVVYNGAVDACAKATQWQWALTLCRKSDFLGRSFSLEACDAGGHLSPLPWLLSGLEEAIGAFTESSRL